MWGKTLVEIKNAILTVCEDASVKNTEVFKMTVRVK